MVRALFALVICLMAAPAWAVDGLAPNGELPEWLRFQFDLDEGGQVRDDKASWFVLPGIGYTSDTLVAFSLAGLVQWRMRSSLAESSAPSRFTGVGIYTTNRQWRVRLGANINTQDELHVMRTRAVVGRWRPEYFGLGPRANGPAERYDRNFFEFDIEYDRAVVERRLYVGGLARMELVRIAESGQGALLAEDNPEGADGGRRLVLGVAGTWDTRDVPAAPYRGAYARLELGGEGLATGSTSRSFQTSLDARAFTSRREHVWASQAILLWSPGRVPFYALPGLGGSRVLRGLPERRFIDAGMWALQTEYRTPFLWRFGGAAFASMGDVAPSFAALGGTRPKFAGGVGLRVAFLRDERVNLRVDAGFGEGDRGVYISVGEAF